MTLLRNLWDDEAGLILSAEMVIILTISVLGMVVGLSNLQTALLGEFADLSLAFQSLNQSYGTPSYRGCLKWNGRTSWVAGSNFVDVFDGCVGYGVQGYGGTDLIGGMGYNLPATVAHESQVVSSPCSGAVSGTPSSTPVPSEAVLPQNSPSQIAPPVSSPCNSIPNCNSIPMVPSTPCQQCQ